MPKLAIQLLSLLLATPGCDKPSASPPSNPTTSPTTFGSVHGKVTLSNYKLPPPAPNLVNCGNHQVAITDQTVLLNRDGTLRNVIIYLKNAPPAPTTATPAPALLDQVNCNYQPHVLVIRTNQAVRFKSSDDTMHNVHTTCEFNKPVNFATMRANDSRDITFDSPEIFRVKCDVHPWMSAWIAVLPHSYYSLTADAGTFEIKNSPTGNQTLIAWHERFGELEQTVNITADKATEIIFNFKPPEEK